MINQDQNRYVFTNNRGGLFRSFAYMVDDFPENGGPIYTLDTVVRSPEQIELRLNDEPIKP